MLLRLQGIKPRSAIPTARVFDTGRHCDHQPFLSHHRRLNRPARSASEQLDAQVSDDVGNEDEEFGGYCMPSDITVDNDTHEQLTVCMLLNP